MDIERYNRHIILPEIGIEGQKKLNAAKVLVVGAGGLGTPVLIYLAAAGIGELGIVDDDVVSVSNLQRQILYKTTEVNQPKVEMAKAALQANNPALIVKTYKTRFTHENAMKLAADYDVIVDCTDNYASRYLIDETSKALEIPMVYGSISKFTGQASVFNYKGSKSYRDLFAEAPEVDESDPSRLGVLGVLPGIIGSIQANETIKIILEFDGGLINQLLLFNSVSLTFNKVGY